MSVLKSKGSNAQQQVAAARVCGAILVFGVLGYLALGEAVYYWKENVHHYESGALSALLALHQMQENYKVDHGSYAADFAQLGVLIGPDYTRA